MKSSTAMVLIIILVCMVGPGINYFLSGRSYDNSALRNLLVVVQILGGVGLIILLRGRGVQKKDS